VISTKRILVLAILLIGLFSGCISQKEEMILNADATLSENKIKSGEVTTLTIKAYNNGDVNKDYNINGTVKCDIKVDGSKYITLDESSIDFGYLEKPSAGSTIPIKITANKGTILDAPGVTVKIYVDFYANYELYKTKILELEVTRE